MKLIQNLIGSLLLVTLLTAPTVTFTGCSTFGGSNAQSIQTAAKLAAYIGTQAYLTKHPETRPAFELARNQLAQIEVSDHVDLVLLLSIVNQLPVKELKSPTSAIIITSATILISNYANQLPVEKLDDLKPVAKAMREGIDLALAQK